MAAKKSSTAKARGESLYARARREYEAEKRRDAAGVAPPDEASLVVDDRAAHLAHLQLCRDDVNAFCEYVLRDEETKDEDGNAALVEQNEIHVRMQAKMNSDRFVVVIAHPESGKSNQIGVGRVLWKLGRNPNLQVALVGNVQKDAQKTLEAIKRYITESRELREVFPHLQPAVNGKWNTEEITVERSAISRFPSVQTVGVHGNINGARIDMVVADDVLDMENTRGKMNRDDVSHWFRVHILSRLRGEACECAFLTNTWHPEDLAHELIEKRGFSGLRFPVMDREGRPNWPTKWSVKKIAQTRKFMSELLFQRLYMCVPRDDGAQVFTEESIARCVTRGRGYGLLATLDDRLVRDGAFVVTGVDLAVTRKMKGAVTSIVTAFIHPNGDRQVIGIRSGRWSGPQILRHLADVGDCFGGVIVVEDNSQQRYLVEVAQQVSVDIQVPVLPFTTGRNKIDPVMGIDSMAAELDAGKWIFPSGRRGKPPEVVETLLNDLRVYDPASHPGDHLMSMWFARTYAQRVIRRRARANRGVTCQVISGSRKDAARTVELLERERRLGRAA